MFFVNLVGNPHWSLRFAYFLKLLYIKNEGKNTYFDVGKSLYRHAKKF